VAAVLALGATGLLPSAATAKQTGVAPPGNSGVSQYMEDIPTVHGNKPTSSVVIPSNPGGGSGGSGGSGNSGGSSSSGGSSTSSGFGSPSGSASTPVIPTAVVKKLVHSGSAGRAAAAVAEATSSAPVTPTVKSKPRKVSPAAPATSVVRALTGSTGGGGLGAFLPVLLIGLLVIVSAVGIFQRRRPT